MIALIGKTAKRAGAMATKPSTLQSKQVVGGDLRVKPDVAVIRASLVLALGETTLKRDVAGRCVQYMAARRTGGGERLLKCSAHTVCAVSRVVNRYKPACMSAAACGSLQLRIHQLMQFHDVSTAGGECNCGYEESLFPIPLVESYRNRLRLYYGKTLHNGAVL